MWEDLISLAVLRVERPRLLFQRSLPCRCLPAAPRRCQEPRFGWRKFCTGSVWWALLSEFLVSSLSEVKFPFRCIRTRWEIAVTGDTSQPGNPRAARQSPPSARLPVLPVPNPLSGSTMCFLSRPALAPGFVKRSRGSAEGQSPAPAARLTSGTPAGAGSIPWLVGSGAGAPEPRRNGGWSSPSACQRDAARARPAAPCPGRGEGAKRRESAGPAHSQNSEPHRGSAEIVGWCTLDFSGVYFWNGARCILVMLNLVKDPA